MLLEHPLKEGDDLFEVGLLRVNEDRRLVAYAQLGHTTVSITRGADGRVRVEIDDIADEDVYVSINAYTATADTEVFRPEQPWHEKR